MWKSFKSTKTFFLIVKLIALTCRVYSEVIELTSENIDEELAKNEFVIVNFYMTFCYHSQQFEPIFEQTSNELFQRHAVRIFLLLKLSRALHLIFYFN